MSLTKHQEALGVCTGWARVGTCRKYDVPTHPGARRIPPFTSDMGRTRHAKDQTQAHARVCRDAQNPHCALIAVPQPCDTLASCQSWQPKLAVATTIRHHFMLHQVSDWLCYRDTYLAVFSVPR